MDKKSKYISRKKQYQIDNSGFVKTRFVKQIILRCFKQYFLGMVTSFPFCRITVLKLPPRLPSFLTAKKLLKDLEYRLHHCLPKFDTEGPRLTRILGLGKNRVI